MAGKLVQVRRSFVIEGTKYTPDRMEAIATSLLRKIRDRISHGMDIYDGPAKPLKEGYRKFKTQRGGAPLRNWHLTGITMGHLKVKHVQPNRAVIGFLPGFRRYSAKSKLGADKTVELSKRAVTIAFVVQQNQRRHLQWGMSPSDRAVLVRAIQGQQHWTLVKRSA